ncbi:2OG-Fe(II)-dependent halogenase WelO5 family protein [Streptomyces buecherae]|uniref:2OG-Fe(II)-dependent halogenase WelO5 family protein n=1 Tax=Streptomyces buecherae TaxID=2763006 RepID=UPI0037A79C37
METAAELANAGIKTPAYVLFDQLTRDQLKGVDLAQLAAGVLAALRVETFFSMDECSSIMTALQSCEMGSYDEQVVRPRIAKLGPAVYDFYLEGALSDAYWEHAAESTETRRRLLDGRDPLQRAWDLIGAAWGSAVRPATVGQKPLFAGMIREINNGARMHFDEVVRELPGTFDETPVCQLAFNCHLEMPAQGGEAVVFRRRWNPEDEQHRDGYGYSRSLVENSPRVSVRAETGDAVLFDPRNYHRVEPNAAAGRRATLSFFLGVMADGTLTAWS